VVTFTPPPPVAEDQPKPKSRHRLWLAFALAIGLVFVAAGTGIFYHVNRGPHWEPYISGDAGDFLRHYYPVTVTAAQRTPGTHAGMITVQVSSDLSTSEGLQCAAYVGPKAPRYEPLWGDAIEPVTYSSVNPMGFDEIDLGTLRTGQTRAVRLWVAPRAGKNASITPMQTTVVCFAEHETTNVYLNG
jgi:hypothetical protein